MDKQTQEMINWLEKIYINICKTGMLEGHVGGKNTPKLNE